MRTTTKNPGEKIVKDIKRARRKQYSFEEKIRIVLDALRGKDSIAELCRREGIIPGSQSPLLGLISVGKYLALDTGSSGGLLLDEQSALGAN